MKFLGPFHIWAGLRLSGRKPEARPGQNKRGVQLYFFFFWLKSTAVPVGIDNKGSIADQLSIVYSHCPFNFRWREGEQLQGRSLAGGMRDQICIYKQPRDNYRAIGAVEMGVQILSGCSFQHRKEKLLTLVFFLFWLFFHMLLLCSNGEMNLRKLQL